MKINEIPHKTLDKKKDRAHISGRYTPIGTRKEGNILIDKVIYPINECPYCGSKATLHRRVQENGDIVSNVWDIKQEYSELGSTGMKFDYCLSCRKEFLMELYIWKIAPPRKKRRKKRREKGFFYKLFNN